MISVVTDEQHYMEYDKDPKYLLLETVNADGLTYRNLGSTAPGGWAYDYGKGRVCYFSPGHLVSVLWNRSTSSCSTTPSDGC